MKPLFAAASLAALAISCVHTPAQSPCNGAPLSGLVRDTTAAIIPGAAIKVDSNAAVISDSTGHFKLPCLIPGHHTLHVVADSFASLDLPLTTPRNGDLTITLHPEEVDTTVDVGSDTEAGPDKSPTASGPSQTITSKQLQSLADDPDDLLRELQQLSAAAGGAPSSATVAVDGFDNGEGGTHLPPKSSIAYIKVNPDLFSAEYRQPPFGGGRIEVYTKPGQSSFHGALFATNSSSWMNARDPFSTASTSLGKQRYGFELTGPIRKKGSDFFTSLEHRSISNDAVVNAFNIDPATGQTSPLLQTVPTPQHLWIGDAKVNWQLDPKNTFIVSFDSYNNHVQNSGVGGTSLLETGYDKQAYDYNIHLTDVTLVSAKIMHEARIGMEFDGYTYTPNSTAPQVSVAGAFTSGGSTYGHAGDHEFWSSIIDDVIIQTGKHLIKIGIQPEFLLLHEQMTTNVNGTYTFGGGTTSTGQTITGVQQYINAVQGLPNGSPTAYSNMVGNPEVDVFQFRNAIYYQDDWKVTEKLHFSYGLRYYSQTNPTVVDGFNPRFGLAWSPDKKSTWSLHAHAGLFSGRNNAHSWSQIVFYDGVARVNSTVYNPTCSGAFNPSTCLPLTTGTPIHTIRSVIPNFPNLFYAIENVGFSKTFPKSFTLSADYYVAQMWHYTRTENINAPLNGSPTGPRPFGPDLNILQLQGTGRGYGNVEFMGLTNQSLKRVQFFAGAVRVDVIDNTDDNPFSTPQTTGVNTGEYARRDNQGLWNIFGNATLQLPYKFQFSANYNGSGMQAYNVVTGFDNNGDGDFNDRPQFAPVGTPLCSTNPTASPCGYATPWGELVTSGGVSSLSRNKGVMPWTFYLDTNLQRTFKLTKNAKAEHPQTLTANIRSSNVLNRLNVTAVGNVLGSPSFGRAETGDNGRRIEGGLRYSF